LIVHNRLGDSILYSMLIKFLLLSIFLVLLGCLVYSQDADAIEPVDLLVESANGNFHIVDELMSRGAGLNPNLKDSTGYTPLMYAVKADRHTTVDLLLAGGAEPDDVENDGWYAQAFAVFSKNYDIVKMLADAGANPYIETESGVTAIGIATDRKDTKALELINAGIPVFKERQRILEEKAALGYRLVEAAMSGNEAEMRTLIDMGVDVNGRNAQGWTALTYAAGQGNYANVKMLLNAGSNANQEENDGWTPAMFAAYQGHDNIVDLLLQYGGSATSKAKSGVTVVGAARLNENNHPLMVKKLADHALFEAMKLGDEDIAVEAVDAGGAVETENLVGWTPIILFASKSYYEPIQRLVSYIPTAIHSAVVNHQENDGWTALMFASINGNVNILNLLLDNDANPNIINFRGDTALSLATALKHMDCADILKARGATLFTEEEKQSQATTAREAYAAKARERAVAEHEAKVKAEKEAAKAAATEESGGVFGFVKNLF